MSSKTTVVDCEVISSCDESDDERPTNRSEPETRVKAELVESTDDDIPYDGESSDEEDETASDTDMVSCDDLLHWNLKIDKRRRGDSLEGKIHVKMLDEKANPPILQIHPLNYLETVIAGKGPTVGSLGIHFMERHDFRIDGVDSLFSLLTFSDDNSTNPSSCIVKSEDNYESLMALHYQTHLGYFYYYYICAQVSKLFGMKTKAKTFSEMYRSQILEKRPHFICEKEPSHKNSRTSIRNLKTILASPNMNMTQLELSICCIEDEEEFSSSFDNYKRKLDEILTLKQHKKPIRNGDTSTKRTSKKTKFVDSP